ncbi:GSCFA domain-containing protein [Tellurirhabdus rosea]|uniref:GSCFA domain-containing protein n=1 Tax=Tellurirhabdus rosea TaxID=2674997 RepID=UPI0022555637|nr:GSCFA domain-containing protein [Tellurirhabdus rosea]
MEFRTELIPEKLPETLHLDSRIVTVGSCFAEVMGRQLAENKLTVLSNPFGTLFNPVSIARVLLTALRGDGPDPDLFVEREGLWLHYDFHSSLRAGSREELTQILTERLQQTAEALQGADWLLLTLGTAVVYRHHETGKVVANCHKMPGALFEKYLYTYEHTLEVLNELLRKLKRFNPGLNVLLTVSPVRHIKDTLPVNGVSKALLRSVCHELTVWHERAHYFPAYEIVTDDLRDYRFYEADLIHPNAIAQQYLFEKFVQAAFDDELRSFVADWSDIRRALGHRPFNPDSPAHRKFLKNLLTKLDALGSRIDVSPERTAVIRALSAVADPDSGLEVSF